MVDETALTTCLDAIDQVACTAVEPQVPACSDVLDPVRPMTVGEVCTDGVQELVQAVCDDDLAFCGPNGGDRTCRLCQADLANGQPCADDNQCESGLCSPSGCAPLPTVQAAVDQACQTDTDCLGNLVCVPVSMNASVCRQRAGAGAVCNRDPGAMGVAPCLLELDCIATDLTDTVGTCRARLADGQTCTRNAQVFPALPNNPGCQNFCVFQDAGAPTGTCMSLTQLPATAPCTFSGPQPYGVCAQGSWPDYTLSTATGALVASACTCAPQQAGAQPCWDNANCQDGRHCEGVAFPPQGAVQGTCVANLGNGVACNSDDQCLSGLCDQGPMPPSCAMRPACP